LESIFKEPQDIEWDYNGNNFYIFQSKPITSLHNKNTKDIFNTDKLKRVGNGVSVCNGQAIGKFKIIHNARNIEQINGDEIVYCLSKIGKTFFTKLPKIAGVITNSGILSHGSVILREMNIPAITDPQNFDYEKLEGKKLYLDAKKGIIFAD